MVKYITIAVTAVSALLLFLFGRKNGKQSAEKRIDDLEAELGNTLFAKTSEEKAIEVATGLINENKDTSTYFDRKRSEMEAAKANGDMNSVLAIANEVIKRVKGE